MADLDFQQLSTVQSAATASGKGATIASAATVSPTQFLTFISGTVAIATVTPFVSGAHMLMMIFTTTTPTAFTTTGNIKAVATPSTNLPVFLTWNPIESKYYVGVTKAT